MSKQFQGRGFVQLTGKNMSSINSTAIPSGIIGPFTTTSNSGFNAISVSSQFPYNPLTANDFFASTPHFKKYEIYEFEEDVLALSCTWKRLRDSKEANQYFITKLTDKKLFELCSHDDKELARTIRDYYSKKLMMINLLGKELSNFRKALTTLIKDEPNRITDDLFPVAYRLPEFYEYDNVIDNIRLSITDRVRGVKLHKSMKKDTVLNLTPIRSVHKNSRRIKTKEYWFTENNVPYKLVLDPKNPLLHIWDDIFDSGKVLQIQGQTITRSMDDFEYLSIQDWKLCVG